MNILKLAKGVNAYSRKWHVAALKSCDINDAIERTVHGSINHKAEVAERRQKRGSNLVGFSRIIHEHHYDRAGVLNK